MQRLFKCSNLQFTSFINGKSELSNRYITLILTMFSYLKKIAMLLVKIFICCEISMAVLYAPVNVIMHLDLYFNLVFYICLSGG